MAREKDAASKACGKALSGNCSGLIRLLQKVPIWIALQSDGLKGHGW
jgi:hypothetical protein